MKTTQITHQQGNISPLSPTQPMPTSRNRLQKIDLRQNKRQSRCPLKQRLRGQDPLQRQTTLPGIPDSPQEELDPVPYEFDPCKEGIESHMRRHSFCSLVKLERTFGKKSSKIKKFNFEQFLNCEETADCEGLLVKKEEAVKEGGAGESRFSPAKKCRTLKKEEEQENPVVKFKRRSKHRLSFPDVLNCRRCSLIAAGNRKRFSSYMQ